MLRMASSALGLLCASALFALPPPPAFFLPGDVIPVKHIVDLTIDPASPMFDGWVRIDVELRKPGSVIWVNAKDLTPKEALVESAGRSYQVRAEAVAGEFIGLELPAAISPGHATLSIHYRGRLDEKGLNGPYRRKIGDDWYVFTTFAPIEARRAFPCFDEPRFKTPWELTIHVKRDLKAFANAPSLREVEEPGDMKAIQFAPTRPLPAEMVAFAVGPFDVFDRVEARHTPIRVIAPKGHAEDGRIAAQSAVDVLARLEDYTGMEYQFTKLDQLALPASAFGAVEHPGLITYRSQALLIPPGTETPEKTRTLRNIEAHEMAHQWFGNLVTPAGWEDVWLSEGFATWLSAKVMHEELSFLDSRERVMAADGARPVRLPFQDRNGMRDVYDPVVYQKGAAVLLMLEGWLGEAPMREGLRAYLKRHAFANATTADLAKALESAAGVSPTTVMSSFLDQAGVPAMEGDLRCDPASKPRLEIRQINPAHHWTVPVCWRAGGLPHPSCTVVDSVREIEPGSCPSWFYLNAGGTGYYRTEWTASQLAALSARGLSYLNPAERLTLAFDLHALERPSRPDVAALLKQLAGDSEPEVAKAAGASRTH